MKTKRNRPREDAADRAEIEGRLARERALRRRGPPSERRESRVAHQQMITPRTGVEAAPPPSKPPVAFEIASFNAEAVQRQPDGSLGLVGPAFFAKPSEEALAAASAKPEPPPLDEETPASLPLSRPEFITQPTGLDTPRPVSRDELRNPKVFVRDGPSSTRSRGQNRVWMYVALASVGAALFALGFASNRAPPPAPAAPQPPPPAPTLEPEPEKPSKPSKPAPVRVETPPPSAVAAPPSASASAPKPIERPKSSSPSLPPPPPPSAAAPRRGPIVED